MSIARLVLTLHNLVSIAQLVLTLHNPINIARLVLTLHNPMSIARLVLTSCLSEVEGGRYILPVRAYLFFTCSLKVALGLVWSGCVNSFCKWEVWHMTYDLLME